jgi:hypothetical protein
VLLQVAAVSAVSEEVTKSGRRLWLGNLVGSYVSYIQLAEAAEAGEGSGTQAGPSDDGRVAAAEL